MNDAKYGADDTLLTLSKDGEAPECRLRDADQVVNMVRRLWTNDTLRSETRAKVAGLVGGNPPFRKSKLREANMPGRTNINWGTARSYMENGSGAFYDLFSEAPGLVAVRTSFGKDEAQRDLYSQIMSAEMDKMLNEDPLFDYEMQQSQWEMTLFSCGPLIFEDAFRVLPRSVHCGDLKVPERTRADAEYFEMASIDIDWYPPELYAFIKNEAAAADSGWDVGYTKEVIYNAMEIRQPNQQFPDWEFFQQEIKNNSLTYYDDTKVSKCAIVFVKEFNGRITQVIVEREPTTKEAKFMFKHVGRYENWRQCLHPMYIDRGHGGFHHSVVGMGVKLFGPMAQENRNLCNLNDKMFAPDILFKPTTTEATNRFQLAHMSNYGVLSAGFDVVQQPVRGNIQDGLVMFRTTSELMRSNLSSYRQQVPMQKSGNPATKFEKQLEATQSGALGKTTFNRYYKQMDCVYAEITRRACNLNSNDPRAQKYQTSCMEKGVPRECFGRIESAKAVRVVGEGSAFLRRETIAALQPIVGSLPEDGKQNWINDFIAANAGQQAVQRYNRKQQSPQMTDEQDERIANQVADMRVGVPPVISPSQNALRFAAGFLKACVNAIQSVQQGAEPSGVVAFLNLAGPATLAHIKRVINDPLRESAAQEILKQAQQVMKLTDQLTKAIQKRNEQQKQQAQKSQQVLSDIQLANLKTKSDIQIKQAKAKQQMAVHMAKTRQQLALADASTASQIHRENARARLAAFQE